MAETARERRLARREALDCVQSADASPRYYRWPCYVCGYKKPLRIYGHLSMCHWCALYVRVDGRVVGVVYRATREEP